MNRYKLHVCSALLLLIVGLAFGADARGVTVALPVGGGSVHDVLQVSDRVLAPYGFVRGQRNSVNSLTPDNLTVYTRHGSAGNPTACNVYLSNARVVFSFIETASPHSNSVTVQLCNQLANALMQRYNPASIAIY